MYTRAREGDGESGTHVDDALGELAAVVLLDVLEVLLVLVGESLGVEETDDDCAEERREGKAVSLRARKRESCSSRCWEVAAAQRSAARAAVAAPRPSRPTSRSMFARCMVVCLLGRLEDGSRAVLARQQRPRLARTRPDRSAKGGRTRREGDVVAVARRTGGEARASVIVDEEGPGSANARRERRAPRGRRAADGPAQTRQLAQAAAVLHIMPARPCRPCASERVLPPSPTPRRPTSPAPPSPAAPAAANRLREQQGESEDARDLAPELSRVLGVVGDGLAASLELVGAGAGRGGGRVGAAGGAGGGGERAEHGCGERWVREEGAE